MCLIIQVALRMLHAIVRQICMVIFATSERRSKKDCLREPPESRVRQ